MKSKSTIIILLILAATLVILSQNSQYDEKLFEYFNTIAHISSETEDPSVEIQSRYQHMADDLTNSVLNAGRSS